MKHIAEWEAVLLGQRDVQTVISCGRLQFEIKTAAETFAQRQSPRFIDTRAKWSVDDQLHSAAFVEKALGNDCALCRNVAQHRPPFENVLDGLGGAGFI